MRPPIKVKRCPEPQRLRPCGAKFRRFARLAAEREAVLREGLTRAGADTLELCTDDDLVDALLRFMDLRQRRVRAPRATADATAPHPHYAT